jgi:hypothetical protein
MAENKKSFMMYVEWIETFRGLSDDEAGKLIKLIYSYVNDENPECDDRIVSMAFIPIKQQLKRDLKKWEASIETKSDSGKLGNLKRWHLDIYKKVVSKEITLQEGLKLSQAIADGRTAIKPIAEIAVEEEVEVEVKVEVKDKGERKEENPPSRNLKDSIIHSLENTEKEIREDSIFLKTQSNVLETTNKQILKMLPLFMNLIRYDTKKNYRPLGEHKSHFISWLRIELSKSKNGGFGNTTLEDLQSGKTKLVINS